MATTANPGLPPALPTPLPLHEWQAQQGDRFVADTERNIGYLVHEDGRYTSTRIGSGQKKVVRYIGRTYDAATPEASWTVRTRHIQGDRGTFGKTGRFLRLYREGKEYTAYGIHSTANIEEILKDEDRYRSMGCILVNEAVLDILEETYEKNGNLLEVISVQGFQSADSLEGSAPLPSAL